MFPKISPKKSWEGFVGSMLLQTAIGGFVIPQLLPVSALVGAVAGLVMTFTATTGDLIESAIKRDFGVKDSSGVIPGHGGVLDRIDGQLFNSVVTWLIFVAVLNV